MLRRDPGGVAEWLKATVSKTVNGGFVVRGFESLPLRCSRRFACKRVSGSGGLINARQLQIFLVLAEELHFGRAAERLHVAQPALSQTLRLLEADLGVRLFDRTTRRVQLSDAGRAIHDEAVRVRESMDAIRETTRRIAAGDAGTATPTSSDGDPTGFATTRRVPLGTGRPDGLRRGCASGITFLPEGIERGGE